MSDDFTPNTEQVRSHYVFDQSDRWDAERGKAFDRWLTERDRQVKLAAHEGVADLLATSLRMIQSGTIGQHNVLSEEKAAGFQLAIDNITNFVRSIREEGGTS